MEVVVLHWGHTAGNSARKPIQNWLTFSPVGGHTLSSPDLQLGAHKWFCASHHSEFCKASVHGEKKKQVSFHPGLDIEAPFQIHPVISTNDWKCYLLLLCTKHCSRSEQLHSRPSQCPSPCHSCPLPGKPDRHFGQRQCGICWCQGWSQPSHQLQLQP